MYTGQTLCYSFVGKGSLGLERVARYSCAYLLYVVDIEIYLSCSILEGIRDPGTESTLDHKWSPLHEIYSEHEQVRSGEDLKICLRLMKKRYQDQVLK